MYKVIENRRRSLREELYETGRALPLAWMLARREWKAKYAHTAMGVTWALIPLAAYVAVYSLFFSVLLKIETDIPYPLVAFSGLIGWNYFKDIVYNAGGSIIQEGELLKRNYMPKLIVPLYKSLLGLAEFGISLALLVIAILAFGQPLSMNILLLPLALAFNYAAGFTLAIWACTLSGRIRDFYHLAVAGLNVAIWLTPVFYLPSLIPAPYREYIYLNPMAGVVGWYRWALLGAEAPPLLSWIGLAILLSFLLWGLRRFFDRQHYLIDFA